MRCDCCRYCFYRLCKPTHIAGTMTVAVVVVQRKYGQLVDVPEGSSVEEVDGPAVNMNEVVGMANERANKLQMQVAAIHKESSLARHAVRCPTPAHACTRGQLDASCLWSYYFRALKGVYHSSHDCFSSLAEWHI